MPLPYLEIFVGLLALYVACSAWLRLDSRYPIAMALLLLVTAAVEAGLGHASLANTTAGYVFLLLAGGIVLLVVDHLRERSAVGGRPRTSAAPSRPPTAPGETSDER